MVTSIRVYAVTDFCCSVCSSDLSPYDVFQWARQLEKLRLHVWDLAPHLIHSSLGPPESPPNGISRLDKFVRFCTPHGCDQQTHTQGERPRYSFCHNRPHLCYACDATQKQRKKPCSGKLDISPHYPCCRIKIKFCMEVVFSDSSVVLKCHQNRLSDFLSRCFGRCIWA